MNLRSIRTALTCLLMLFALPVLAQDDATPAEETEQEESDKGFLTELLQDSLGGEGRVVSINGFSGALSSTATMDSITIADNTGVWLTMEGLTMQWNRSALLRGRVDIELLAADMIRLDRLPVTPDTGLPDAEAQPFALPELPVSVSVGELRAQEIFLGNSILGTEMALTLEASAQLADNVADVNLRAQRIDGQEGAFRVVAGYSGATQELSLDIALEEGEGGIAARLLDLPGLPSVELAVQGAGTLDDLETDVRIATDGAERLTGEIRLTSEQATPVDGTQADADASAEVTRGFEADISGDITALFAPQYHDFFGDSVRLRATGQKLPDGTLELAELDLETNELSLEGSTTLNPQYWPTKFDLNAVLAGEKSVVLPIPGVETRVDRVALNLTYDRAAGSNWSGDFSIQELVRDGIRIGTVDLDAAGILRDDIGTVGQVTADLNLDAGDFDFNDPALAQALGTFVKGGLSLNYTEGEPLELTQMNLRTGSAVLTGAATVNSLEDAFETLLDARLVADDLSKFSGLAGQDISGAAAVNLKGTVALGGFFDLDLSGELDNLAINQAEADKLLRGKSTFAVEAKRDETGTQLRQAKLENDQMTLAANGRLAADDAEFTYALRLENAAMFDPRLPGPATVNGTAVLDQTGWSVDLKAAGPIGAEAEVSGLVTGPQAAVEFLFSVPNINPLVPAYRGPLQVEGRAAQSDKGWRIQTEIDGPYGLDATLAGLATGETPMLTYTASLPDISPIVPKISGPVTASGTAKQLGEIWQVDTGLTGPGGMRARVAGDVATDGTLDLATSGVVPLAIADPFIAPRSLNGQASFDLTVRGPADVSSVSGRITAQNVRLAAPALQLSLTGIDANIGLSGGRATVSVTGGISSGGQLSVNGGVNLTGNLQADLSIALQSIALVDPELYNTTVNGALTVSGPLSGGALISGGIDLGETQIKVPTAGAVGFSIIPDIVHVRESAAVRRTRAKAGLTGSSGSGSGNSGGSSSGAFRLDIRVRAPSQIFVRGRGLDAELGGQVRLTGTTTNVISAGRFELIRGRLDLLTQRFDLDEGSVQMQGDLDPYIRFVATTETSTGTASIIVQGQASDPEVTFESDPEAPEDEVLAQIIFGRDISQLSAFQALQLVNAVRTLAGKGGESVISKLRRGLGVDDLDIVTDDEGNTSGRVGKYLSDNIYTDVTAGQAGSSVSLNIDLTPSVTARGSVASDGESKLGIFFERDY
ncbi:translocation/assembly module TamB domain-containing protein [Neptunicoccus cionae]|uniref:Translocation/assembly module TamB n=1 Tax=Neptunicoccus cionae TaxID=2035344 RepID=A0A916QTD8_9RHOB|nr:translocation/assembly module TamB domain-containing protein [Amylibacter cionae]GGA09675.1 translocation/assembly module TamB [Amylibacter cionae]